MMHMKRRSLLSLSCAPMLARTVFVLAPMVAFAGSGLWETPDGSGLANSPSSPFMNSSAFSGPQLAMLSKSVTSLPLTQAPAAKAPAATVVTKVNGAALPRVDATPLAGLSVVETGAPADLFIPAEADSIQGLSIDAPVPLPEPTTALFGAALVGLCALARYGSGPNAEAISVE